MKKLSVFCVSAITLAMAAGSAFAAAPAGDLWFSLDHNALPDSGQISSWGGLTAIDSPTVEVINGVKWEKNQKLMMELWGDWDNDPATGWTAQPHDSKWEWDGFRLPGSGAAEAQSWWAPGSYNDPVAVNGASIVMAIRPVRDGHANDWNSLVDVFYNQLGLTISNATGQVGVRHNGVLDKASVETAIADGQATVLSLVIQPTGEYKVWANGVQIMENAGNGAFTALTPGGANNDWYMHYVNVGRNEPDGWTVYNGNIGDTFVYKNALSDTDRTALEAQVASSMGIATVPEPGSILAMLSGLVGLAGYGIRRKRA